MPSFAEDDRRAGKGVPFGHRFMDYSTKQAKTTPGVGAYNISSSVIGTRTTSFGVKHKVRVLMVCEVLVFVLNSWRWHILCSTWSLITRGWDLGHSTTLAPSQLRSCGQLEWGRHCPRRC